MTRPVSFDAEDYKHGNVVERFFNRMKKWRGLASRYDKLPLSFAAASSSPRSSTRCAD
jgi:transposase